MTFKHRRKETKFSFHTHLSKEKDGKINQKYYKSVCIKAFLNRKNMCMKFTASSRKACSGLSLDPAVKSIP